MKRKVIALLTALVVVAVAGASIALAQGGKSGARKDGPGFGAGPGVMGGGMGFGHHGGGMGFGLGHRMGFGGGALAGELDGNKVALVRTIEHSDRTAKLAQAIAKSAKKAELKDYASDLAKSAAADATEAKALYKKLYGEDAPTFAGPALESGTPSFLALAKDADKVAVIVLAQQAQMEARHSSTTPSGVDNSEVKTFLTSLGKDAKSNADKLAGWYKSWYGAELPTFGPPVAG